MFPSKLVYVSAHLISLFVYQMILDFWIPLENTRRKKYSKEKNNMKKKTKNKNTHKDMKECCNINEWNLKKLKNEMCGT